MVFLWPATGNGICNTCLFCQAPSLRGQNFRGEAKKRSTSGASTLRKDEVTWPPGLVNPSFLIGGCFSLGFIGDSSSFRRGTPGNTLLLIGRVHESGVNSRGERSGSLLEPRTSEPLSPAPSIRFPKHQSARGSKVPRLTDLRLLKAAHFRSSGLTKTSPKGRVMWVPRRSHLEVPSLSKGVLPPDSDPNWMGVVGPFWPNRVIVYSPLIIRVRASEGHWHHSHPRL